MFNLLWSRPFTYHFGTPFTNRKQKLCPSLIPQRYTTTQKECSLYHWYSRTRFTIISGRILPCVKTSPVPVPFKAGSKRNWRRLQTGRISAQFLLLFLGFNRWDALPIHRLVLRLQLKFLYPFAYHEGEKCTPSGRNSPRIAIYAEVPSPLRDSKTTITNQSEACLGSVAKIFISRKS